MKNTLRLNHETRAIVMDRTFAKFAANTMSQEYAHLQRVRMDYPTYTVEQRHIKKAPAKECYRGLTYTYMKDYIITHGTVPPSSRQDDTMIASVFGSKNRKVSVSSSVRSSPNGRTIRISGISVEAAL